MSSFISKNDSKCLYGIAILLMVFHHCFLNPAFLHYNYVSVFGRFWEIETRLAWTGKICVAIYAFISGYALSKWAKDNAETSVFEAYKKSLSQLARLYGHFWLVFSIFVPVEVFICGKDCSLNMVLRGMFFGEYFGNGWWYVKQYLIFMLLFPIINIGVSWIENVHYKYTILVGVVCVLGVVILRALFWNSLVAEIFILCVNHIFGTLVTPYVFIFITAYILARYDIYEKISKNTHWKPRFYFWGITILLIIRYLWTVSPTSNNCDVILTPFFIFCIVQLLHTSFSECYIAPMLRFLGGHSTFMWLTHTFYIYEDFQWIGLLPKYSILVYFWVVVVSLGNAVAFNWLYKKISLICRKIIIQLTVGSDTIKNLFLTSNKF